eukprot:4188852-Pyramimonas_sp.AAC.1
MYTLCVSLVLRIPLGGGQGAKAGGARPGEGILLVYPMYTLCVSLVLRIPLGGGEGAKAGGVRPGE